VGEGRSGAALLARAIGGAVGVVGAQVVAVGQRPPALCAAFDGQDLGGGEFFEGAVDGIDGAMQPAGEQCPAGHPDAAGVAVAGEDRVEPEGGVGDGGVEHPLGDDGEALLDGELGVLVLAGCWCYNVASRFCRAAGEGEVVSHGAPSTASCGTVRAGAFAHRLLAAAT